MEIRDPVILATPTRQNLVFDRVIAWVIDCFGPVAHCAQP